MKDLLHEVLNTYGLKEVIGKEHNPEILAMFAAIGFDWVKDDDTAWCSASLNYFCKKLGYERSKKLDAKSLLKVGEIILEPELGDIVVLWRESISSWKGHVGIYINSDENDIWILGGNQSNMLNITAYTQERLLGYRRLKKLKPT